MKLPKTISLKRTLIIVTISILLVSGIFYTFAANPSSTFYLSSGVYPGAPSFTIWKESNNYFAKNIYGELKYSGLVFPTLIQACIDDLTSGGVIFLMPGQYYNNGIEVNITNNGISIIGCGYDTQWINNQGTQVSPIVVRGTANFRIENFVINSTQTMTLGAGIACEDAWIRVAPSDPDRIPTINVIRNMIIDNQYEGLRFDNSTWINCENIDVRNPYERGIMINEGSAFIYLTRVHVFAKTHNYNTSLHIKDGFSIYCFQNEFLAAQRYGVLSDPDVGDWCSWLFFTDVRSECNQTATTGVTFEFSDNNGGTIQGVYLQNCWAVSGLYGIVLNGVEDAQIHNCQVHGNDRHGLIIQDATNTKSIDINGGHFNVNSQGANDTYDGIHIEAGVSYFSISSAHFIGYNFYDPPASNAQAYAINVATGASDWYIITDNLCFDNGQSPQIFDGGTGTNKNVTDNVY